MKLRVLAVLFILVAGIITIVSATQYEPAELDSMVLIISEAQSATATLNQNGFQANDLQREDYNVKIDEEGNWIISENYYPVEVVLGGGYVFIREKATYKIATVILLLAAGAIEGISLYKDRKETSE